MSGHSSLSLNPAVSSIGMMTPVTVQVTNPNGIRSFSAYMEQNGEHHPVFVVTAPETRLFFWRHKEAPRTFTFMAGKLKAPGLKEGNARVVIETVSNDFRGI